jgi:hypothetical protein
MNSSHCKYYAGSVSDAQRRLLPPLDWSNVGALWLWGDQSGLQPATFDALLSAVAPLRGIVCHASLGTSGSPRINDHQRAFGRWGGLVNPVLLRNSLEAPVLTDKVYCDAGWLATGAATVLPSFVSRSTTDIDAFLAFIPHREDAARQWLVLTPGFLWLWLQWQRTDSSQRVTAARPVVHGYISKTLQLGGLAGLAWRDDRARPGLVYLGGMETIELFGARLEPHLEPATSRDLDVLIQRGGHLLLCSTCEEAND